MYKPEDENKTSDNELTISRKIDVILGECAFVTHRAREKKNIAKIRAYTQVCLILQHLSRTRA